MLLLLPTSLSSPVVQYVDGVGAKCIHTCACVRHCDVLQWSGGKKHFNYNNVAKSFLARKKISCVSG